METPPANRRREPPLVVASERAYLFIRDFALPLASPLTSPFKDPLCATGRASYCTRDLSWVIGHTVVMVVAWCFVGSVVSHGRTFSYVKHPGTRVYISQSLQQLLLTSDSAAKVPESLEEAGRRSRLEQGGLATSSSAIGRANCEAGWRC